MSSVVGDEEDELDGQAELGLDRRVLLLGVVDRVHSKDDDGDIDIVDERRETEMSKCLRWAAYRREQHRQRRRAICLTMRRRRGKEKKLRGNCRIYIPVLT